MKMSTDTRNIYHIFLKKSFWNISLIYVGCNCRLLDTECYKNQYMKCRNYKN